MVAPMVRERRRRITDILRFWGLICNYYILFYFIFQKLVIAGQKSGVFKFGAIEPKHQSVGIYTVQCTQHYFSYFLVRSVLLLTGGL